MNTSKVSCEGSVSHCVSVGLTVRLLPVLSRVAEMLLNVHFANAGIAQAMISRNDADIKRFDFISVTMPPE